MNEQQRLSYLRSMGYQMYYPRRALPGAKTSPRYPATVPEKMSSVPLAQPKPVKLHPFPLSKPAAPETPREPVKEKSVQVSASTGAEVDKQAPADALQFNVQYFRINDWLAVINEEPHQLKGRQNRETHALLNAIMNALLVESGSVESQGEVFAWPVVDGIGLEPGKEKTAAGLALMGFINQRQEQDGFQHLLMFTSQLGEIISPSTDALGEVKLPSYNCTLTLTHSLQSMLVHPLLKREAWAHMQPLASHLAD